jgi:hypothetical protein
MIGICQGETEVPNPSISDLEIGFFRHSLQLARSVSVHSAPSHRIARLSGLNSRPR